MRNHINKYFKHKHIKKILIIVLVFLFIYILSVVIDLLYLYSRMDNFIDYNNRDICNIKYIDINIRYSCTHDYDKNIQASIGFKTLLFNALLETRDYNNDGKADYSVLLIFPFTMINSNYYLQKYIVNEHGDKGIQRIHKGFKKQYEPNKFYWIKKES